VGTAIAWGDGFTSAAAPRIELRFVGGFLVSGDRGGREEGGGPMVGGGRRNGEDAAATTSGRHVVVGVGGGEVSGRRGCARGRRGHEDTRQWLGSEVADEDVRERRTQRGRRGCDEHNEEEGGGRTFPLSHAIGRSLIFLTSPSHAIGWSLIFLTSPLEMNEYKSQQTGYLDSENPI
jgi:hypothetical protein